MSASLAVVTPVATSGKTETAEPAMSVRQTVRLDFRTLLDAFRNERAQSSEPAQGGASEYLIQRGDTLTGICAAALRASGATPTQRDIMAAVKEVAAANGISNPDFILAGQQLDLSVLSGGGSEPADDVAARGGAAVTAAQWGISVLSEVAAAAAKAGDETARTQPIVEGAARVSSEFGPRKNPFNGRVEFHSGIDIAAPRGSNVYPVRPGNVTFSGWQPGYGKVVIVSHDDNTETLYAHNEANLVRAGQHIGWGEPLARVGSTGDSTGPHVHFELRRDGRAVNPSALAESISGSVQVAETL